MPSGQILKAIIVAVPTISATLIILALINILQHEADMRRMMGGHMAGMMPWMAAPLITALASIAVIPVIFYFMVYESRSSVRIVGLSELERSVVEFLSESGGQATQREIAQSLAISRLKAHRVISSLKKRSVVDVQRMGKTNLVKLNTEPGKSTSLENS